MDNSPVLIGREKIQEYLNVSKATFFALVAAGMPAAKRVIGSREYWISDKDLISEFFKGLVVGVDMAPDVILSRWLASNATVPPGEPGGVFSHN